VIEDTLLDLIDPSLRTSGATAEAGEEWSVPALEVIRYYRRSVRWNRVPVLGRAQSVVAVVRQPLELAFSTAGYTELLIRVSRAASSRFPPWKGAVIGLTAVILTSEGIAPGDDEVLGSVLNAPLRRFRVVPFGLLRVNLGQEAVAFALRASPEGLFSESHRLADLLSEHLRRFVPPLIL
jgi:hypothetical protein